MVPPRLGAAVVAQRSRHLATRGILVALALLVIVVWAWLRPAQFWGFWLSPDQQGRFWFERGDYQRAAARFESPRWRGISLYAAQDFAGAAQYFSQYQDAESLLARANALAHEREYLPARRAYEDLARRYPRHPAPAVNLPIVQELIDANRMLSQSQADELGDVSSKQDEGPESSEGDERVRMLEREQLSAEELQADPALTEMWLRQVQRNPAEFLSTKFYIQLQRREAAEQ